MSNDCNETTRILCAETTEQLKQKYAEELRNVMKLRLVKQQLKQMQLRQGDNEQIERALKLLSIQDNLKLGDNKETDYVLDLGEIVRSISLSYTERRSVRQQLLEQLNKTLRPIVEYYKQMSQELQSNAPTLTASCQSAANSSVSPLPTRLELLKLEQQRRENLVKLVELRNRKCAYLKAAAELKTGNYLAHELTILEAQAGMNEIKSKLLRDYMFNHLATCSEHSVKALKQIEGNIKEKLENLEG